LYICPFSQTKPLKNPQPPSMSYETMKKGIQLIIGKLGEIQ
jgi:hypothetical protein